jgi:Mn2+/Fe2+ NRAMP family transporter
VLVVATLVGIALNFTGIDPIRALYRSAVINGVVSAPLMVILVLMSSSRVVVGNFTLPVYLRIVGWAATGVMLVASVGFLTTQILSVR